MSILYGKSCVILSAMLIAGSICVAQDGKPGGLGVNVRDFGAVGDGIADDTQAIQQALNASKGLVIFPGGRYRITETLKAGEGQIVGYEKPTLIAGKEDMTLLHVTAWRTWVNGVAFQGGGDQLSIGNANTDQGSLRVSDCWFNEASGVAVQFRERSNSSFVIVENCMFNNCMQALVTWVDQAVFRQSWISTSVKMKDKAVIESHSWLTCEDIYGVPRPNGHDQRWIDNYHILNVKRFRFGGEGSGFTPVVNFARRADRLGGNSVFVEDSWVSALGNQKRACAVFLEEVPNQVVIRNNALAGCPPVAWRADLPLDTYFDGVQAGMIRFDIDGNYGEFASNLPKELLAAAENRSTQIKVDQLSSEETQKRLAEAIKHARTLPDPAPAVMTFVDGLDPQPAGHQEQTQPGTFVDLNPHTSKWDLNTYMNATTILNSEYLAMAEADDDVVVLWRQAGGNCWPNILIDDVEVDPGKTPFLSWRMKDNGVAAPGYAVKVTDVESGKTFLLTEVYQAPYYDYRAYDLRRILGAGKGKRKIEIHLIFLGCAVITPTEIPLTRIGDVAVIDFVRLEAESSE